ncbi:uncharacterized protein [Nicotiana sylvestris]|uniref:uncharacterized protein isoform X2 n=1 Tax=Nicotiana sylvestris TaxID=4096 RepID=UPI00388C4F5F
MIIGANGSTASMMMQAKGLLLPVDGRGSSFNDIATDCGLKEDTPKAMNKGNCPLAIIPCQKSITGKQAFFIFSFQRFKQKSPTSN